jgi:hypothetical protein
MYKKIINQSNAEKLGFLLIILLRFFISMPRKQLKKIKLDMSVASKATVGHKKKHDHKNSCKKFSIIIRHK